MDGVALLAPDVGRSTFVGRDTMRAWVRSGDSLRQVAATAPLARGRDVVVQVFAAGLHASDAAAAGFGDLDGEPVGVDVAGSVVAVGAAAGDSGVRVGDAVVARLPDARRGALAQYVAVDVAHVAPKADALTFEEAASVPSALLGAAQALERAGVSRRLGGGRVLISRGGCGPLQAQVARHMFGASTVSLLGVGAADLPDAVARCVQPAGEVPCFDAAIDNEGAGLALLPHLRPGAALQSFADAPPAAGCCRAWLAARRVARAAARARVDYEFVEVEPDGEQLGAAKPLFEERRLRPVVAAVYGFEEAAEAYVAAAKEEEGVGVVVVAVREQGL